MKISAIIIPTDEAVTMELNTVRHGRPGCLMTVGTLEGTEQIEIQRPLVVDPNPADDADWALMTVDDTGSVLRVGNDALAIPVGAIVRIVKPATVNVVGVSWS